jgi:FAD/FMN-containing dehydrogenase
VVKNVAGFDLTRTLIGSWGTLGVITSASLRLRARPPASETWAVPVDAANAHAMDALRRGPLAPAAYEEIPETVAVSLGLSREPHIVLWLAGGAAHVAAARAAVLAAGPARELPDNSWRAVRSAGPFTPAVTLPADSWPADLNERVRLAFDPAGVFTSAAVPSHAGTPGLAHV